jgi:hypothetical protein
MTKTEKIDRTLLWSLRIFGLGLLALVGLSVLVFVVIAVASAITG